METDATYVYCVAELDAIAAAPKPPRGLPKAGRPRALELDAGSAAIVARVPLAEYAGEKVEARLEDLDWVSRCAVGHEAVVEHYARAGAVVPMKLFTLFSSDDRARADLLAKKRSIKKALERVRGREEWGVRLTFDEARMRAAARPARPAKQTSGTAFLMRKKGERDVSRELRTGAAREAAAVYDELAVACEDAKRRPVPAVAGSRVLLDAVFLVPKDGVDRFTRAAVAEARRLEPLGYDLALSGPWPPYNFVSSEKRR